MRIRTIEETSGFVYYPPRIKSERVVCVPATEPRQGRGAKYDTALKEQKCTPIRS